MAGVGVAEGTFSLLWWILESLLFFMALFGDSETLARPLQGD